MPDPQDAILGQLDALLVPVSKAFRYPLPLPAQLAGEDGAGGLHASASLVAERSTVVTSPTCVKEPDFQNAMMAASVKECEGNIPGLQPWRARVHDALYRGEECKRTALYMLDCVNAMRSVTETVHKQSDNLSQSASVLMVRKAKLELVQEELQRSIAHFTRIEDLCREADDPMLSADSARFPALFQELDSEMKFLSRNKQFKSAKAYATRLALAQQKISTCLVSSVKESFHTSCASTKKSDSYTAALNEQPVMDGQDPGATPTPQTSPSAPVAETLSGSFGPTSSLSAVRASPSMTTVASLKQKFREALEPVNAQFLADLDNTSKVSLRRLVEMLDKWSSTAAEAFGDDDLGSVEDHAVIQDVLSAYREARTAIVGPLLKRWLLSWADSTHGVGTTSPTSSAPQGGVSLPHLTGFIYALIEVCVEAERAVVDDVWVREDFVASIVPRLSSDVAEEIYQVFRSGLLRVDGIAELCQTIETIQSVHLRPEAASGAQELSDLWLRLTQDAQERLFFRASVYIRQDIARSRPSKEVAQKFIRLASPADATVADPQVKPTSTSSFLSGPDFVPVLQKTVKLLRLLYPVLEFSVFAVFAREAIRLSLQNLQDLQVLMAKTDSSDSLATVKSLACQLAHVVYLHQQLVQIDSSITVVEKSLNLSVLRERRLEINQSSQEAKRDVQSELNSVSHRLIQTLTTRLSTPFTGAAKKSAAELTLIVSEVDKDMIACQQCVSAYISTEEQQRLHLMHPVALRVQELKEETAQLIGAASSPAPPPAPTPHKEVPLPPVEQPAVDEATVDLV